MKSILAFLPALGALVASQSLPVKLVDSALPPIVGDLPDYVPPVLPGYTVKNLPFNSALNAPLDCNTTETFAGARFFPGFSPALCGAFCSQQSGSNATVPCKAFNHYLIFKNGLPYGQICSMYSVTWPDKYATNDGEYRGADRFSVGYSFLYSNATAPAYPACP